VTDEGAVIAGSEIIAGPQSEAAAQRPGPTREDRAGKAFLTIGVFVAAVLLIVGTNAAGFTALQRTVSLVPAAFEAVAPFVMLYGVAGRRPWALAALTPVLWILIVEGIVSSIVALGHSNLQIPIGTLLGIWVLRAPPEHRSTGAAPARFSIASLVIVVLFLAGPIGPVAGNAFLRAGGFLNRPADLETSLTIDCGPGAGSPPETISLTYHWSWRRTEPFATGSDRVSIRWLDEADSGVIGYELDQPDLSGSGAYEANVDDPQTTIVFGTDLAKSQAQPQDIRLVFRRVIPDQPGSGGFEVRSRYLHGPDSVASTFSSGLWDVKDQQTCTW
jgi:hypothetical protein